MSNLSVSAQDFFYRVNRLGMEDGLSFRHATCIVQDNEGFMWIGTRNGLNRYDGYEFVHYTSTSSSETPALSGNIINDLEVDLKGNIWVATNLGLDILNPSTNEIQSYSTSEVFPNKSGIKGVDEISITKYSGRIYIHSHLYQRFDRLYNTAEYIEGKFKEVTFLDKNEINYSYIANVFEESENKVWYRPANTKKFFLLSKDFEVIDVLELPDSIGKYRLVKALTEQEGEEYGNYLPNIEFTQQAGEGLQLVGSFCDSEHTFMINGSLKDGFQLINDSIDLKGRDMPLNYFIDNKQDTWMQKGRQLGIVKNEVFTPIDTTLFNFNNNNVTHFEQSRDGTVWVTTSFGVYRVTKEKNPFKFHLASQFNDKGFGKSLRAITKGTGNLIFASVTNEGVWQIDLETGAEKQLIPKYLKSSNKNYHILPYGMYVSDTILWMANWFDEGLLKFNLSTSAFEHLHCNENLEGYARSMATDFKSKLWIGTDRGLNILDLEMGSFIKFKPNSSPNFLDKKDISYLHYSSRNGLWVGTREDGVYLIDKKGVLKQIANKESGLSSNTILSIYELDSLLWIGTPAGLNSYDIRKRTTVIYNAKNGLPDQTVNGILEREGKIWLSTNKGLSEFDTRNKIGKNYFLEDGLLHEEFNYCSSYKLNDSTVLFGGMNGMVKVATNIKAEPKAEPSIILTGFERSGKTSISNQSLSSIRKNGVTIDPSDKSFRIQFAYLDLFSSKHIQYKYKLKGYDENWTLNGRDNFVRFNKLPAGQYTFQVKALNRYGAWSTSTLIIPVTVQQVFYKKVWFIVLCILLLVSLAYSYYRFRVHQIKKLADLRIKIASNLHDDVGSLLTQIGMQGELLKAKVYTKKEEETELDKLVANSKAAVGSMSDVVWSIDSRQDQLSDLLDRMKDYGADLLSRKGVTFNFHQNKDLNEEEVLSQEFRQAVYLIFKEAMNNVVKHSNATIVNVEIKVLKQGFKMIVQDNGSEDKSRNRLPGQGLKNMQMRADRLNGTLQINQGNGFRITLMVKF